MKRMKRVKFMYVCMHACMYSCMYESMHACMHACMYVMFCSVMQYNVA